MHTSPPARYFTRFFVHQKRHHASYTQCLSDFFFLLKVILKFLFKCFDIVRMGFHNRIRVSGDHQDTHQGFRIKDASSYFLRQRRNPGVSPYLQILLHSLLHQTLTVTKSYFLHPFCFLVFFHDFEFFLLFPSKSVKSLHDIPFCCFF